MGVRAIVSLFSGRNGLSAFQTLAAHNNWVVTHLDYFPASGNMSLSLINKQLIAIKNKGKFSKTKYFFYVKI